MGPTNLTHITSLASFVYLYKLVVLDPRKRTTPIHLYYRQKTTSSDQDESYSLYRGSAG